jgi:hypothetical protein
MIVLTSQIVWIGFLLFQILVQKEKIVLFAALVSSVIVVSISESVTFDTVLFSIGALGGFLTEKVLVSSNEQKWSHATFFGMPLWLPLAWGIGTVALVRLGDVLVLNYGVLTFGFVGLIYGIFVEVIMGKIARTQHWKNTQFFGVPPWLPFAWGVGFVAIWWCTSVTKNLVGF